MPKKIFSKSLLFLIKSIRPLLGNNECCIYTITCTKYAEYILKNKPLYIAIPKIFLRILSCNPITGIIKKLKFYKKQ